MVRHHPDDNFLTEFSAGSMDWGLSLAVAAHLQFCPTCKARVARLNGLGGTLLSACEPVEPENQTFGQLMQRIKNTSPLQQAQTSPQATSPTSPWKSREGLLANLPTVVRKLLPANNKLKWRFVSPEFRMARLHTGQNKYDVTLHRIRTGGKTTKHDHSGLEVTLVLQGSFSDGDGIYHQGDFLVRGPGDVHRPVATQNGDCLCLTVLEAPVMPTAFWGRFFYPKVTVRTR